MAKNTIPTKEEIKAKLEEFSKKSKESIENKTVKKSATTIFLEEIKEVVRTSLEGGVTYAQIVRDIKDVFGFPVSPQTLRAFAQNELGFKARKRSKKSDGDTVEKETKKQSKNTSETTPKKMPNSDGIKNEKEGF